MKAFNNSQLDLDVDQEVLKILDDRSEERRVGKECYVATTVVQSYNVKTQTKKATLFQSH